MKYRIGVLVPVEIEIDTRGPITARYDETRPYEIDHSMHVTDGRDHGEHLVPEEVRCDIEDALPALVISLGCEGEWRSVQSLPFGRSRAG